MKKQCFILMVSLFSGWLFVREKALASAYTYLPLEPIPGFDEAVDFPQYVSALYKFGIWTVGIAALLMLSVGGFMYMTSAGNNSRIEAAKTVIYDSLWGLIVAMFAWLLLFIINPDLVSGTLNFRKVKLGTYSGPAATAPQTVIAANVQKLSGDILNNGNIDLNYAKADCADASGNKVTPKMNMNQAASGKPMTACSSKCGSAIPCQAQAVMSDNLLSALVNVSGRQSYTVVSIAGGRHAVNSDHYQGRAADIVPANGSMSNLLENARNVVGTGGQVFCDKDGQKVDCSQATHVHISVGS